MWTCFYEQLASVSWTHISSVGHTSTLSQGLRNIVQHFRGKKSRAPVVFLVLIHVHAAASYCHWSVLLCYTLECRGILSWWFFRETNSYVTCLCVWNVYQYVFRMSDLQSTRYLRFKSRSLIKPLCLQWVWFFVFANVDVIMFSLPKTRTSFCTRVL